MAHEIEQFDGGQAAFVAARRPGWHQLGTVYAGQEGLTSEQVLGDGHLGGWQVRKVAYPTALDPVTGQLVVADRKFMIVRTNPVNGNAEHLGFAGNVWQPVQNEDHVDFFTALVEGGAGFDTAMSLRGGQVVVVTMKLPESVKIAGVDQVDLYIAVINHHDGTGSFTVLATPVRIVCANTLAAGLRNFNRKLKIRHTEKATSRVQEARNAMGLAYDYMDAFQDEAERMIQKELSVGQLEKVVGQVFQAKGKTQRSETIARNRSTEIISLFTQADTQASIRGTAWAGYQAIVEYVDWQMPVRGADSPSVARASRAVTGYSDWAKDRAFELLRVPA